MNVTIRRPFLDNLKDAGFKKAEEHLRYNSWKANASLKVDLADLTDKEFDQVEKVLKSDEAINHAALRCIEFFRIAKSNPKDVRSGTVQQFATLFREYVSTVPKYRFYEQDEDGDWFAYVATSTGYAPPKRSRDGVSPAYAWVKGAYYSRGETHTQNWTFYIDDVKGKTVSQVLGAEGLVFAHPGFEDFEERYEREVARYKELRGAYGRQMWGAGYAKTVSTDYWRRHSTFSLDVDGRKAKVVIDDHVEGTDEKKSEANESAAPLLDGKFWKSAAARADDDDDVPSADESTQLVLEVPLLPEVLIFNLEKHEQAWCHVNRLEDYEYDVTLGDKLVLPEFQRELIQILVSRDRAEMKDIIRGKAGGSIVMCSGEPGTGKTLTAEVFSEVIKRPLYIVASSQLGTTPEKLESELKLVLNRASRLGAILLIDESDVFVHERGNDMVQNAVVGVFLRVLEYFQGTMFMTTNRATVIDDAITSRCTAQVKYEIPTPEGQAKIWKILSDLSGIKLPDSEIKTFVKKHPRLSGRDVKGLLKLANMIAVNKKEPVTSKLLEFVLQFKPTSESGKTSRKPAYQQEGTVLC